MRKLILGIIIILFIVSAFVNINEEKEIRVRIIPNSNNLADLEIKNEVKNIVICYLNSIYEDNYDGYLNNINLTFKELENVLDDRFNDVSVTFDKHTLYNKAYNNKEIKNRDAYTLYVILGNGNGDNWWGSIYPEFLGVNGDDVIKYESLLVNVFKLLKEK